MKLVSENPPLIQIDEHRLTDDIITTPPPQPFYGPFSGTTWVSQCQKRTSGLYGAR